MAIVNYVSTGPFVNGSSPGLSAGFFNNVEHVFQEPSGGFESARYFIAHSPSVSGALCSCYVQTLSRTSVPISITLDVIDGDSGAPAGNPASNHLTEGGVLLYVYSSGVASGGGSGGTGNVNVGGDVTFNF